MNVDGVRLSAPCGRTSHGTLAVKDGAHLDSALAGATNLLDSLTRELWTLAELPGPDGLSLPGRRKDAKAVRQTSARLLEAVEPLADALRPAPPVLEAPEVLCAPGSLELDPYLRLLRWALEDGESLRVLAFPDQSDASGPISAILGGAKEKLAAAMDKSTARTLVAVTDRRIVTARTGAFLEQGEIRQVIPLDLVRYVRAVGRAGGVRRAGPGCGQHGGFTAGGGRGGSRGTSRVRRSRVGVRRWRGSR
ncbi:hypothetical protein [Kitasatospora cineracea]|uniref:hypothetical protein n=1 Tax=Kitasatospora cineracea TaxID=88074 RepID=UPI0037F24AE2